MVGLLGGRDHQAGGAAGELVDALGQLVGGIGGAARDDLARARLQRTDQGLEVHVSVLFPKGALPRLPLQRREPCQHG
ncbi:hypothetical protein EOD42_14065 [Rhodovarius crocodyli]|uniref:Uncharacterized protein n=1 Tax=Rhodovarius crocodyli TaxID=1979269 RepID=A0A437MF02_9PROT|nr:hypothetical protein EOD42_14065 [Rhodovarius crocodyli]